MKTAAFDPKTDPTPKRSEIRSDRYGHHYLNGSESHGSLAHLLLPILLSQALGFQSTRYLLTSSLVLLLASLILYLQLTMKVYDFSEVHPSGIALVAGTKKKIKNTSKEMPL